MTNRHLDRHSLSTDQTAYLAARSSQTLLSTGEQQNEKEVVRSCNGNIIGFANVVPDFSHDRNIPSVITGGRIFCFNI